MALASSGELQVAYPISIRYLNAPAPIWEGSLVQCNARRADTDWVRGSDPFNSDPIIFGPSGPVQGRSQMKVEVRGRGRK